MSRARSLVHCTLRELMMWRDHPSMLPLAEPQLARWLSPFGRFALDVDVAVQASGGAAQDEFKLIHHALKMLYVKLAGRR
jgi:hypothetical protein